MNGKFFKVSFLLLLLDKNVTDFGILILYSTNVLSSHVHFNNLPVDYLKFSNE